MLYRWSYCKGGIPKQLAGKNQIKWNAWPRTVQGDWESLKANLTYLNLVPHTYEDGEAVESAHDGKTCLPSISGAIYKEGEKRGKEFIQSINLLILDVDNKGAPETHLTWEQALEIFPQSPYKIFLYSSYSHTQQRNKFRVIFPLASGVKPEVWKEFLEWAVAHLGLTQYREAMDLGCMRKPAQIYFLRGCWEPAPDGSNLLATFKDGEDLVPPEEAELVSIPVPELPGEAEKREVEPWEAKFIKQVNVDLKTLDLAAALRHKGIVVKEDQQISGGTKNRSHCPWPEQHTGGRDDDGAYIVQIDDKWPVFRCDHSSHQDLHLADVLEWVGAYTLALYGDPYVKPMGALKPSVTTGVSSLTFGEEA